MRRTFVSHRSLAIAALAVGLSACNGNSGFNAGAPSVPLSSQSLAQAQTQAATETNASPRIERQNPARRDHRAGEPLLQQPVLRLSRSDDLNLWLQLLRKKDYAAAG